MTLTVPSRSTPSPATTQLLGTSCLQQDWLDLLLKSFLVGNGQGCVSFPHNDSGTLIKCLPLVRYVLIYKLFHSHHTFLTCDVKKK